MTQRSTQRGQSLIEFGAFITLFVVIALGLITFGHAFMVANMITHAARDGARLAANWTPRGTCHGLDDTNTVALQTQVTNEIAAVTGAAMTVHVTQNPSQVGMTEPNCAVPGVGPPTVIVTVTGWVPY